MQHQQQQGGSRGFQSRDPATNEIVAEFPFLSNDDITKKVECSWKAFQTYSETDLNIRRRKIAKLADIMENNVEKYAKIITQEVGKPYSQSVQEVQFGAILARYYVDNAEKFLTPKVVTQENKESLIELRPVGPILVIIPFNYPFEISLASSIPSLILGNTILYRTADSTPSLGKAIEELLIEAGFGNGEFQTIYSSPEQTDVILAHKHVMGVTFTGSTKAGRNIAAIAGKYGKKAVLELGGSDPFIVLDDADIEKSVTAAVASRLANCGQLCCAAKRFIIDDKVYEQFKEKLIEQVSRCKVGLPMNSDTQLGPLARSDLLTNIERQVNEGVKGGAKILFGGKRPEESELQKGNFYLPTVAELDKDNILFREETFGPVFALVKGSGDEELLRLANDTEYGLSAAIMSRNVERAKKMSVKVEAGTVFINDMVFPDIPVPFGGVKSSGFGRTCGEFALHEFANIKTTTINGSASGEK